MIERGSIQKKLIKGYNNLDYYFDHETIVIV